MSQRFQFTIEVQANAAPLASLTTATQTQTAAAQKMAAATAATTTALTQQAQAASRLSLIHLPEPTMVVQQRQMEARKASAEASRQAHQTMLRNIEEERQARLKMGAKWQSASRQAHQTMLRNIEEERQARLKMGAKWQSASRQGGAAAGNAGGVDAGPAGGMGRGMALLEGSRAIEDLQYGIGGVLNNIPTLVMALGRGAGLAGGLSLAAVLASQLVKHLGDIGGAVDEEALKAKLAAVESMVNASLDALSTRMQERLEADLTAAQKAVDAKLNSAKESLAGLEELSGRTAAAKASKDQSHDAASMAEQALADVGADAATKAQTAGVMQERAAREAAERKRAEDDKLVQEAAWRREITQQKVTNATEVLDQAEGVSGQFGQTAQAARQEIIDEARSRGVVSDQERVVSEYQLNLAKRERLGRDAARDELDSSGIIGGLLHPTKRARAKATRQEIAVLNKSIEEAAPFVEESRARVQSGDVTFSAQEGAPAWQRKISMEAQGAIEAQSAREKQALAQAEQARAELAAAQRELEAAKQAEQQARTAQMNNELVRQSERMGRGELPEVSPEQMGGMMRLARERGGLAEQPMLPSAGPMLPDLSGAEAGFGAAMDRTGAAVQQTMERMVSASEAMVTKLGGALGALEGRLGALEGRLDSYKASGM